MPLSRIPRCTRCGSWFSSSLRRLGLAGSIASQKLGTLRTLTCTDVIEEDDERPITASSLAVTVFGSLFVAIVAKWVRDHLPELGDVVNATTWTILIVSVLGLVVAVTQLSRTAGARQVGSLMLYMVIGNIASGSDFSAITQTPLYLLVGGLVLLFHALIMIGYAKLAKTDLFTIAVASASNVGGLAYCSGRCRVI